MANAIKLHIANKIGAEAKSYYYSYVHAVDIGQIAEKSRMSFQKRGLSSVITMYIIVLLQVSFSYTYQKLLQSSLIPSTARLVATDASMHAFSFSMTGVCFSGRIVPDRGDCLWLQQPYWKMPKLWWLSRML